MVEPYEDPPFALATCVAILQGGCIVLDRPLVESAIAQAQTIEDFHRIAAEGDIRCPTVQASANAAVTVCRPHWRSPNLKRDVATRAGHSERLVFPPVVWIVAGTTCFTCCEKGAEMSRSLHSTVPPPFARFGPSMVAVGKEPSLITPLSKLGQAIEKGRATLRVVHVEDGNKR